MYKDIDYFSLSFLQSNKYLFITQSIHSLKNRSSILFLSLDTFFRKNAHYEFIHLFHQANIILTDMNAQTDIYMTHIYHISHTIQRHPTAININAGLNNGGSQELTAWFVLQLP